MALIECSAEDGVVILTLNRPEKRNAVTPGMQTELVAMLREAEADEGARAVILTGAGRDFCVGGDFDVLKRMQVDKAYQDQLVRDHSAIADGLLAFPKPTIAAVNGPALGFGAELAAFCDMVVMSENAWLADPHVQHGLGPAPGALLIWPRLTSRAIAAELLLTGREVGAEEALRLGLANRVAPEGEALSAALDLARTLCAHPREGLIAVKSALRRSYSAMWADLKQTQPTG